MKKDTNTKAASQSTLPNSLETLSASNNRHGISEMPISRGYDWGFDASGKRLAIGPDVINISSDKQPNPDTASQAIINYLLSLARTRQPRWSFSLSFPRGISFVRSVHLLDLCVPLGRLSEIDANEYVVALPERIRVFEVSRDLPKY